MDQVTKLIAQLDTPGDRKAEAVFQKIKRIGRKSLEPLLAAAQDGSRPRVLKWSLEALGELGDARAIPVLVKSLKNERMTVKFHAIKGLMRMKARESAKHIERLLADESGGVRGMALAALAEMGFASPKILGALTDEQWYIRQAACTVCGELGLKKAKARLQELADSDQRKAVRTAASAALKKLN